MQLITKPDVKLTVLLSTPHRRPYIHIEIPLSLSQELLIKRMIRAEYNSPTHSIKIFPCHVDDEENMGYPIKIHKIAGKSSISFDLPARPYGITAVRKTCAPIARREKDYLWVKL